MVEYKLRKRIGIRMIVLIYTSLLTINCVLSYDLKCPEAINWKLRAVSVCGHDKTDGYFCLYDSLYNDYTEGCNGPDWDRRGHKRIISGSLTRGNCSKETYQPFRFWTIGNSECVYSKTDCPEEGQNIKTNGSSESDRTCRCDFSQGYSYVQFPTDPSKCMPSLEDCSCVKRENSYILKHEKLDLNVSEKNNEGYNIDSDHLTKSRINNLNYTTVQTCRRKFKVVFTVVLGIGFIFSFICLFVIDKSFSNKNSENVKYSSCDESVADSTDESFIEDEEIPEILTENMAAFTDEEINYLRIVQLIFGVASPVVRIVFNKIVPIHIYEHFWKNIFKDVSRKIDAKKRFPYEHEHTLPSEAFDIAFMVKLLKDLKIIAAVDQLSPLCNTEIDALLSRIYFYRSVVVDAVHGKMSYSDFQKNWQDIGQIILMLAAGHLDEISRNRILRDQLLELSPIRRADSKLQRYVLLTETYPQRILQKLVEEFCLYELYDGSINTFLGVEMHNFLHKRKKQSYCCLCSSKTFSYIISNDLWNQLYSYKDAEIAHTCKHNQTCVLRYKVNSEFQLGQASTSVLVMFVLNSPRLLRYLVKNMCTKSFSQCFESYKHCLFHAIKIHGNIKCCCCKDEPYPQVKKLLTFDDWLRLFSLTYTTACELNCCCCHYSINDNMNIDNLDDNLLNKIMQIAGPFQLFDKIQKNTLNNFLSLDGEYNEYIDACKELLGAVRKDFQFVQDFYRKLRLSTTTTNDIDRQYVGKWIQKNVQKKWVTSSLETDVLLLFKDGGRLATKNVSVSKSAKVLFSGKRTILCTHDQENFLKINYLLNQVVCPVVRMEFDSRVTRSKLGNIISDILDRDLKSDSESLRLTSFQQNRIFQKDREVTSNDLDLFLMIRILQDNKATIKALKNDSEFFHHLNSITEIRRQITRSSNGVLVDSEFDVYWNYLLKIVTSLKGGKYDQGLDELKTRKISKGFHRHLR